MRIGVPKEANEGQTRVAATPDTAKKLIKLGYEVVVEKDAGVLASYPDDLYTSEGISIVDEKTVWESDIVISLDPPLDRQLKLMRTGATLISRLNPGIHPDLIQTYSTMGITAISMDAVPRISRAQSIDARSSMTNLSGYRAVIEAAEALGRSFGGQVTAAGMIKPSRVYVIGVGVAGLSAIGTASSMGAEVYATDVRPEVAEQVESLGATFVEIPVKQESADGYARAMTEAEAKLANKVYAEEAAKADVVITTAMVQGRTPPLLLDDDAIAHMKPGSVIVDLGASPEGGNASLTEYNNVYTTSNGVTIIGYTNLPSRLAEQASQLYGQNIVNFFKLATPDKNGVLVLNEDDEIIRGMTVTLDGKIMWPPPPISVSVAPAKKASEKEAVEKIAKLESHEISSKKEKAKKSNRTPIFVIGAVVLALLIFFSPEYMKPHFMVLMLSVIVGFYVIKGVSHSLHTPLMSVTNAISGIIIVGALLTMTSTNVAVIVLAFIAIALTSINIFGGFKVTGRMLEMFAQSSEPTSSSSAKSASRDEKGDR